MRELSVPSSFAMLEAFGIEPTIASVPQDGFWQYEITDERNITLILSFNTFERWFEATIRMGEHELQRVVLEDAQSLRIIDWRDQFVLRGICESGCVSSQTDIFLHPSIRVASTIKANCD